jgi:hypothetical protein
VTEKRLVEKSLRIVMPGDKRRGCFVRDIVDAGDGDVGAAEPFLDIGNVGLVFAFLATVARSAWAVISNPSAAEYPRTGLSTASGESALWSWPVRLFRVGRNSAPFSSLLWPAASR